MWNSREEGGFALAVVVVLLFAIGIAGATGYQVVNAETRLAIQAQEARQALAIAEAGLQRFLGEPTRGVRDTVRYDVDGGTATVVSRVLRDVPGEERMYLLSSTGLYQDPRIPGVPARRTVQRYAVQRQMDFMPVAAVAMNVPMSYYWAVGTDPVARGVDISTPFSCPEGGTMNVAGVWAGDRLTDFIIAASGDSLSGAPRFIENRRRETLEDLTRVNWDLLVDPSFQVDHEGTGSWPNFAALPADSFPVIRVNGNFYPSSAFSGRGVLIVEDDFQPHSNFTWDGIILAGFARWLGGAFTVRGTVLTGFDNPTGTSFLYGSARVYYHHCNVLRAAAQLTYLEPVENSWAEVF